jgi:molybdate transport system regulatory protein
VENQKLRVQLRVVPFIGPGKMALLEEIDRQGSISAAARSFNMSYAHAWRLIEAMNRHFKEPLVSKSPGGQGGGGAHLTDTGRAVASIYRSMEEKSRVLFAGDIKALELLTVPFDDDTTTKRPRPSSAD